MLGTPALGWDYQDADGGSRGEEGVLGRLKQTLDFS